MMGFELGGWVDEALRAGFGFLACWPALWICRALRLSVLQTSALVTLYMIPAWRCYAAIAALVR